MSAADGRGRPAGPGYRGVWAVDGSSGLLVGGTLGRLSLGLLPLALLLTIARSTGSFAVAGGAVGLFGATNVVASPLRARALDLWGHRWTLVALTAVYLAGLAALVVVSSVGGAHRWLSVALAGVAGAVLPPFGTSMRVLVAGLRQTPGWREQVYALDAASEEVTRTLGPLAAGAISTVSGPDVALVAVIALDIAAVTVMARSAPRERVVPAPPMPATASRRDGWDRVTGRPGFLLTLAVVAVAGVVLGVLEIGVVAAAAHGRHPGASGILLAALSVGSALGAVLYGRHRWRAPPGVRLLVGCGLLTAACALLASTDNLVVLGGLLVLAGLPIGPVLISAYLLADQLTPPSAQARATTWVNTGTNAGIAAGSAVTGLLTQHLGVRSTFLLAAGVLAAATGLAGGGRRALSVVSPGWSSAAEAT